jgi:hypothetical protein
LSTIATRLAEAIDGEDPKRLHPAMVLCRAAIVADSAASKLSRHLDTLLSVPKL